KDVTIPDGSKLTSIGNNAFRDCSKLESMTIPEGVTSIGNTAFRESGLKTIDFYGTEAGWNAVKQGTDAIPSGVTMNYKGWLVTLDANGGTPSQTTVRTDKDGKVVSPPTPARTGHTFKGWFDAPSGGRQVVEGATVLTAPMTLYAMWEAGVPATGVTLDEDALTLKEGGTATLTATVSPEGTTDAVVWASTDPSVATVTDGKVKGIKAGAAVVTATAGGRMALCLVTVTGEDGKPGPGPAVASITLDEASLSLAVGNTATLKATVDPAGASVGWATSDPSVATVSGGKVTAKKAGTAVVTATAGGRLAFCVVTVTEDGKPAPGPGRIEAALVSGGEGEAHLVLSVGAEGSPKAWTPLRVWLELLSLEDGGIVHASAEPGDVFGAFMAVTDGEGLMTIDVDALTWADGPERGKRASIPAGTYRIHLAGADESYAESVLGPTVILAATQGDGEGNGNGTSGGGCDGLSLGGAALLALAGAATRRRR
ncbi:MAG: Ig-like domain-containing protein, partial [Synergistaceae bacterium]|nr:Ig-like domain-containing protein [Synergistaceae bacterium]